MKSVMIAMTLLVLTQSASGQGAAPPSETEGSAVTKPAPSAQDDLWHFQFSIPFWMPSISGNLQTSHFNDIPVSASISQVLSHLSFGAIAHAEARKSRVGLAVDAIYVNVSDTLDREHAIPALQTLDLALKQVFLELFSFYRVVQEGNSENPHSFDLLAGARYYWTQSEIDQFSDSLGFVDLMLGMRGQIAIGKHLSIRPRSDFAFLGTRFTWNLIGEAAWTFSDHWTVSAGYRAMDIDYENSSKQRIWNLNYHGPVIGVILSW